MISDPTNFIMAMLGGTSLEIIAVILGLINITLIVRRSIWNFPFGIVMVAIYSKIFFDSQLYSQSILQFYFFAMQIYGWWYWQQDKESSGEIHIEQMTVKNFSIVLFVCGMATVILGKLVGYYSDATTPYWDASVAVLSVTAQLLMSRRYIENWILWILVDVLAIGLYYSKGLYPTVALYIVFLGMVILGLIQWRKARLAAI